MLNNDSTSLFMRQLDSEGFFVWRRLFSESLIDVHLAAFEDLRNKLGLGPNPQFQSLPREQQLALLAAEQQFHYDHIPTQELCFNRLLASLLRLRFKDEPVMHSPMTGFYQRNSSAHTDSLGIQVDPRA